MGTTQLLSVPYALYANSAGNTEVTLRVSPVGDTLFFGSQWVIIPGISAANGTTTGPDTTAGNRLKSCRQVDAPIQECHTSIHPRWDWDVNNHGTDHYGFSAVPAGYRGVDGAYTGMGQNAEFRTSSEIGSGRAWARIMLNTDGQVITDDGYMKKGISVRCLKSN